MNKSPEVFLSPGKIQYSDRIVKPDHIYTPERYDPDVASVFNQFVESLSDMLSEHSTQHYPNAVIHPEPSPAYMDSRGVTFMAVWGSKVAMPHPDRDRIPEYFGKTERRYTKAKRSPRHTDTLDGFGLVGSVIKTGDSVQLTTIAGKKDSEKLVRTVKRVTPYDDMDLMVIELMARFQYEQRPLRIHSGIRWHANNDYIGIFHAPDDESLALKHLAA